ncbi:hypothetical protein L6452_37753 [Arctium lappa]|uniref:Uncharacterized protein n=1 Tax=Arctium lappa TaxID=4217 RepID=A0ACB8Y3T1_ARCLA|nr:hypothetical protein L6452_37753 [Arctium lappa]
MCLTELFSVKCLESYEYIRIEEMKSLPKSIFDSTDKEILLKDLLLVNLEFLESLMGSVSCKNPKSLGSRALIGFHPTRTSRRDVRHPHEGLGAAQWEPGSAGVGCDVDTA